MFRIRNILISGLMLLTLGMLMGTDGRFFCFGRAETPDTVIIID